MVSAATASAEVKGPLLFVTVAIVNPFPKDAGSNGKAAVNVTLRFLMSISTFSSFSTAGVFC